MVRSNLFSLAFATIALLVSLFALAPITGVWSYNSSNIGIARAASLPSDSPDRLPLLADAEGWATRAAGSPVGARAAFTRARIDLERGELPRATEVLRSTGQALEEDPIAQFFWADAEWRSGNQSAAFEHWRASGALVFFLHELIRARDHHQWQEMEKLARIAVGIAPENAEAHYDLGDALAYQSVDNPEAAREIDRAAELTSDNEFLSTIFSRKGEVLAARGEYRLALEAFQRASKVAALDARPRIGYARAFLKLNPEARDQAIGQLTQVTRDSPWAIAAYIELANIAESGNDAMTAEKWYRTGLAKNPNDAHLLYPLARFLLRHSRGEEARGMLVLALRFEPHADELRRIAADLAGLSRQ